MAYYAQGGSETRAREKKEDEEFNYVPPQALGVHNRDAHFQAWLSDYCKSQREAYRKMEEHYSKKRRQRHLTRGYGAQLLGPDGDLSIRAMTPLGEHGSFIPVQDTQVESRLLDTSYLLRPAQSRMQTRYT